MSGPRLMKGCGIYCDVEGTRSTGMAKCMRLSWPSLQTRASLETSCTSCGALYTFEPALRHVDC
eukprot:scaffold137974_cov31-Tisochrysis_lutea.AAC.1